MATTAPARNTSTEKINAAMGQMRKNRLSGASLNIVSSGGAVRCQKEHGVAIAFASRYKQNQKQASSF